MYYLMYYLQRDMGCPSEWVPVATFSEKESAILAYEEKIKEDTVGMYRLVDANDNVILPKQKVDCH